MRINSGGFHIMKKVLLTIGAAFLLSTIALSGCNEQKKPVISNFEAIPNEIEPGQTADLQWSVSDATSVTINNGIGVVPSSGNRSITPTKTTTYTLTATGSSTITATTTITVTEPFEKPDVTMAQNDFYVEIQQVKNGRVLRSDVQIIAININTSVNQTSALRPMMNEGNGNPTYLGAGDVITFQYLADFSVGDSWNIQLTYNGEIIGQCTFRTPRGPYDMPVVRMTQVNNSVVIIGIINGPIDQSKCLVIAENSSSHANQTAQLGITFKDNDGNPSVLNISDQIIFNSLGKFKAKDSWIIRLAYNGTTIGQCNFINPGVTQIPT